MKAKHLPLLAMFMLPACSVAPLETPSETAPPPSSDPTGETASDLIPAGYMIVPGGNRVSKQCVTLLKPGEKAVLRGKNAPCPIAAIKPTTIKKTLPVDPSTLVGGSDALLAGEGEQNLMPLGGYSFNVPTEWVAAMGSDYLLTQQNLGQKSQGNITQFSSNFAVPYGATGGDQGQLTIVSTAVQKWGGVYPAFNGRFANIGVYLQQGWNGMWGSWQWTLYTYADDGYGNWTFQGPIYDVQPNTVLATNGWSETVYGPGDNGSVTRWHINVNSDLYLDFDYSNPMDFNFVMSTVEFYNVAQRRDLMPDTNSITFSTRFYGSQKGCVPGAGNLPWWFCGQSEFAPPKWRSVGTGGNMPDYRWTATADLTTGPAPYNTSFFHLNQVHK